MEGAIHDSGGFVFRAGDERLTRFNVIQRNKSRIKNMIHMLNT